MKKLILITLMLVASISFAQRGGFHGGHGGMGNYGYHSGYGGNHGYNNYGYHYGYTNYGYRPYRHRMCRVWVNGYWGFDPYFGSPCWISGYWGSYY